MTRDELLKKICPLGTCDCGDDYESCNCDDCNRVLEEWLYDYEKQIRAKAINDYYNKLNEKINTDTRLKETIKDIHDNVAREMYCKGIDEFADKLNAKCSEMIKDKWNSNVAPISWAEAYADFKDDIEEIAEELKAGVKNEN